jgi:hypothetical protein
MLRTHRGITYQLADSWSADAISASAEERAVEVGA